MVSRVAVVILVGLSGAVPSAAAPPGGTDFKYIKRPTREGSREATLAQYVPSLQWGQWHLIGPFDNTDRARHDIVYQPEVSVDLDATYRGKDGRSIHWRPIGHAGWGPVNLKRFGSDEADTEGIAYLYREVSARRDVEAAFEFGSDDGLKLWVNGRLLIDVDAYRGLNVQDHQLDLPLNAGRNTVLAKITQGVGGWQFQMRPKMDGRLLAQLDYRLDLDFPGSAEARHYRLLTVLEPPGVVLEVGGLYVAQRGELTRIVDLDGDDRADLFETVSQGWGISGNYHEYAFGPKLDGQGRLWVTLCVGFCGQLGKSIVPWRGWAVIVHPDGTIEPVCGGLRAPNGLGRNAAGDMFYTDNQGDWVATCKLSHLERGDWHGHPSSRRWYDPAGFDPPRGEQDFKPPAVWFPYGRMGQSASDIMLDDTGGRFGPFEGQLFVGDQTNASIMRVDLERVDGVYQGACFAFRSGLDCGVNRLRFGADGSLFAGLTNRGWGGLGRRSWGLQRLVYTGVLPFEVLHMRAAAQGFTLEFTSAVDPDTASRPESYELTSFTYHRVEKYGSPEVDHQRHRITRAAVSDDRRSVALTVQGLREGYVHELHLAGVRSAGGQPLLHDQAYYTLNVIPGDVQER